MGVAGRRRAAWLVGDDRQMAENLAPDADAREGPAFEHGGISRTSGPGDNYGRFPSRVSIRCPISFFHGGHDDESVLVVDPDGGDLGPLRKPLDGRLHFFLAVQKHSIVSRPFDQRTGSVDVGFAPT